MAPYYQNQRRLYLIEYALRISRLQMLAQGYPNMLCRLNYIRRHERARETLATLLADSRVAPNRYS